MLDARRLLTLQTVLRTGSFAAAAERLGYTQSAVSQQIAELERSTGMRLLERRPVRPTDAGLVVLRAADAAGEAIAAATTELSALREGRSGKVRLGAFASAGSAIAAPSIAAFARSHPGIDVTLVQVETDEAYDALIHDRLDLALTFDYDIAPQEPPRPVARSALADDPVLAALPATHLLAGKPAADLAEIAGEAWIAAPLAGLPLDALAGVIGRAGFRPTMRFEGDDFGTVLALVANGLGIALIPSLALQAVPEAVAVRPLVGEPLTRFLYTARLRTRTTAPAIAALDASIRRHIAG